MFLVVALVAALLGFGGIAGTAVGAAEIVFMVAITFFLISSVFGVLSGRSPRVLRRGTRISSRRGDPGGR